MTRKVTAGKGTVPAGSETGERHEQPFTSLVPLTPVLQSNQPWRLV